METLDIGKFAVIDSIIFRANGTYHIVRGAADMSLVQKTAFKKADHKGASAGI